MIQEVTMSNNKQSSIEWLFEQIKNHIDAEDGSMGMNWLHDGTFEQAKAMHESEIQKAFDEGNPNGVLLKTGEQYYNETFGGNK